MNYRILYAGLAGLAALALSACQSPYASTTHEPGIQAPTPNFPVRTDPNPPAPIPTPAPRAEVIPAPTVAESAPPVRPTERIETASLPPPPANPAAPPPAAYNPPAPVVSAPPPPPPPPPAPEMRATVTGPVVDAEGPSAESHTVKSGETLYSISRSLGLTVKQAADINGLKEPYTLKVGQRIKGKPSRGKAYVVQSGDTLSGIGRRFSVTASALAEANDTEVGSAIRPGQRLLLPKGYRDQGAVQVAAAPAARPAATPPPASTAPAPSGNTYARVTTAPPPARTPAAPPPTQTAAAAPSASLAPAAARPAAPVIIPTAPPATPTDIRSAGTGKFTWPISGRQLGGFGARGGAQQSNGLNIAANVGTSVKASAPGEVIYAGSELQGYGNLVLVRHDGGFVTVYAHLSQIGVKMQDQVRQGQEIGQVGQSGGVTEPQLYFEMRHQQSPRDMARPFDPMLVLPNR